MIENMEPKKFNAGEIIFSEGDPAGSIYLIDKGKVEISKNSANDKTILATIGWSEIFGEMALIDNSPRSASAIALEETWVHVLDRDVFKERIDELHPIMKAVLVALIDTAKNIGKKKVEQTNN